MDAIFFHGGVLIERAYYYAIITGKGRTNWYGVLIKEGALTEGVRFLPGQPLKI